MRWLRSSSVVVMFAALTSPKTASLGFAQSPNEVVPDVRSEARKLAQAGLAALDAAEYDRAVELLTAAEAKFHAPTHLLFIAQAHASAGRLVRALATYEAVAGEVLPDHAPDEFKQAQALARSERDSLRRRVPRVRTTSASGGTLEGLTARVDGQDAIAVPVEGLRVEIGDHEIVFGVAGTVQTVKVHLEDGERLTLALSLAAPHARPAVEPIGPIAPTEPATNLIIPGVIVLSSGVAALMIGGVTGGLSLSEVSDLEERCPKKRGCAPSDEQLADDARLFGNIATASIVLGGLASTAGIILLAWPSPEPARSSLAPVVLPRVGFSSIGLEGTF